MWVFTPTFDKILRAREKDLVPVIEFYDAAFGINEKVSLTSLAAIPYAFGRFSDRCFEWTNNIGTFTYEAKVTNWGEELVNVITDEFNNAQITFSNVERGENSFTNFILNNRIQGSYIVIRLVSNDAPDDYAVLWWGKCNRPKGISDKQVTITAKQEFGNLDQEIPFRNFQAGCPLDFARPGGACLGYETLNQKAPQFQLNYATYGSAGCISQFGSKQFQTCTALGNQEFFQGQPLVAVSGQFVYYTTETVVKKVLFFFTKKETIQKKNTVQWASVNQSENNEAVPIAVGRAQIQGHPFVWADTGTDIISLQGFCEGKIHSFDFTKCRTFGLSIVGTPNYHLGEYGGVGTQQPDPLFNGAAGFQSKLAYAGFVTTGSTPQQVDDAPAITSVVKGLEVPVPDSNGEYNLIEWTNNPVHLVRYFMSDKQYGRIPISRFDTADNVAEANHCNTIVEDRSQSEVIVLPSNEETNYGAGYRRYRSATRYSAYKDMYYNSGLDLGDPDFEQPFVDWFTPFSPPPVIERQVVLRQLYGCNGVLNEKMKLFDFLHQFILPTFKGYILYAYDGTIKIRSRKKADNSYVRETSQERDRSIKILNVREWLQDRSGYLLVGVNQEFAEIRQVVGIEYSPAGNSIPLEATTTGGLTATVSAVTLTGGSLVSPAQGYIDIGGTVNAGDSIEVRLDASTKEFTVKYITDGVEDLAGVARMLLYHMNANPQFNQYLTAFIYPQNPTRIHIRCEIGGLKLDRALEYVHTIGEEVMRVQAVYENCNDLDADASAQFDNIIDESFTWNDFDDDEYTAVTCRYISAVDDFALTEILPRTAWDIADLEGAPKTKQLDLRFVDNYWQAAFLTKSDAIETIDGGLSFTFETGIYGCRLECGDVIAIKHVSGDGALRYVPCWVQRVAPNINNMTVKLDVKLYLSAAFDLSVQAIEPLLTTTLNDPPLTTPPAPIGTTGGIGGGSDPVYQTPVQNRVNPTRVYSPSGKDIV